MNLFRKARTQAKWLISMNKELKGNETILDISKNYMDVFSHISVWKESGSNVFILSDDLVDAFQNTDVPQDVTPLDFKYPYNSFLIENDNGLFKIKDMFGGEHTVKSIVCNLRESFIGSDIGLMTRNGIVKGDWSGLRWKIMIIALYITKPEKFAGRFDVEEFIESATMALGDEQKVSDLDKNGTRMYCADLDPKDVQNMANMVFNTVAYVTDPNREIDETQKTVVRSIKVREGKGKDCFDKQNCVYLKPPRRYVSSGDYIKSGRKIEKKFWVRGHWRWQACGKNYSERKHSWILPYVKGMNEVNEVSKNYIVS